MNAVTVERGSALKEWAAVVKAIEAGTQILILRKGGVREEGFSTDSSAFYFYPTGFHQTGEKLRPEHRHFLDSAMADKPADGSIRIQSFGVAVESFSISIPQKLAGLAEEYVYTVDEIKKRFEFRPGESMTAAAVRVYRLPKSFEIPVKTKYGGCVSWVNLEDSVSTEHATPVLLDSTFNQRLARVRDLLR